jgi:hypothetical protein
MHNLVSSWQIRLWGFLKSHPFTLSSLVVLLLVSIPFCRRQDSEWEEVYLRAAVHLQQGEELYQMQDGYLYPPFMAWATLPFLELPESLRRANWFLCNAICLVMLFRCAWQLAGGGRLEGGNATGGRERWAAIVGCLCGISYLQNCLAHQQTDIVIATALVVGCVLLKRGCPLGAATMLGLASACKCTGLLWAPYLLWRGRPLAAVWLLLVALGVNCLPNFISSSSRGRSWLEEYRIRFLVPITATDHYVGTWGSDPVYNQSLTGLAQRWCTTSWKWSASDCTVEPCPPLLRPQLLRGCVYALQLLLLAAVLVICGRPFRRVGEDASESRQALECGIVLLLMLLLSPMSSKAHFGTLIVPGFCLARSALLSRSRTLVAVLLGAILLGLLSNKDPLGERLYTLSLWYGVVTWQTMLMLTGCLFAYRRFSIHASTVRYASKDRTDACRAA